MTDGRRPRGILLADDTEDMRMLLDAAFAGSRFEVFGVAADGLEAVRIWREHRSQIGYAALDQRMPGLDGLQVAEVLRADDPAIPIVLFSAELNPELAARAEATGIGILHKDAVLSLPDHPDLAE